MSTQDLPPPTIAHWPPYLTTRRAIAYTGRSRTTINRAVAAGELAIYGRPGGERGERVFERAELDRWLRGPVPDPAVVSAPRSMRGSERGAADIGAALARIDAAARGGRRP